MLYNDYIHHSRILQNSNRYVKCFLQNKPGHSNKYLFHFMQFYYHLKKQELAKTKMQIYTV